MFLKNMLKKECVNDNYNLHLAMVDIIGGGFDLVEKFLVTWTGLVFLDTFVG
jgi:hypothetical protein